jgi:hypothetical protein
MLRALDQIKPDCLLIEGPPDADEMIPFAGRAEMRPPVAILVHAVETPKNAVFYPFAEFSPEWQAMRWALGRSVPVRFMDLPQWHRMAIDAERAKAAEDGGPASTEDDSGGSSAPLSQCSAVARPSRPCGVRTAEALLGNSHFLRSATLNTGGTPVPPESVRTDQAPPLFTPARDPLDQLALAAGFDDGERWWEHVVEHNREGDLGMFTAVKDAMAELRQSHPLPRDPDEVQREAWMRRTIRAAKKEGFTNLAVICGAWHAPVLDDEAIPKKQDDQTLAGLPKLKTAATWVPWTYDRLAFASGYGAGVHSPGWYEHLWKHERHIVESWMTRAAGLLRSHDIDCSSGHVIEAVRLSGMLATLRGRPLADLSDIADASRSVFCFDNDLPLRLIARELLVGHRLGELPDDVPMVPLQRDLQRLQTRLRLKPEASERVLELDLRNDIDRQRSHLLHRLRLLAIDWGTPASAAGKGTFKEAWKLRWEPGFAVQLIEAGVFGTTIEQAAAGKLRQLASASTNLRELAGYLDDAMLAELGDAAGDLVRQIESVAAVAADVTLLMQTLPELARLLRYGNVRKTDESLVREIVNGIIPRITAGLGGAVGSLNDEAAAMMEGHIRSTHAAIKLIESPEHTTAWLDALRHVLDSDSVHGLVRGRCARLLLDAGKVSPDEIARRLSLTLSRGNDPGQGARWLEGFLSGSGLLLIHDEKLLGLIDTWVDQIDPAIFQELVPLLRRTFSTFPSGERRQIGQILAQGKPQARPAVHDSDIDPARAERALPLLKLILSAAPGGPK